MKKSILIIFSLVMWCMTAQAIAVKSQVEVNSQKEKAESVEDVEYNLQQAIGYIEKGDLDKAFDYLNLHLENNPKSCRGYFYRAAIYRNQVRLDNALSDINNAIKYWNKTLEFKEYSLYWWRAAIYRDLEINDKAAADYTKAYKLATKMNNSEAAYDILFDRAEHYYNIGELKKSDADYKFMLKNNEVDQTAIIGLARNMIKRGEYNQALEQINKCEKIDASYTEIYRFRMDVYDRLGETTKAINDVMLYIQTADNVEYGNFYYILNKNIDYSILALKKKCAENNIPYFKELLVDIYRWNHDYKNAIIEYDKIEKDYGPTQKLYYYRSYCYDLIGQVDKAIEDITKCIEMGSGNDFYGISMRADYYRRAGKYDEAIADYTLALEIEPSEVYSYYQIGWCYELKGDDKTAMEYYNKGIAVGRDYPYIFLMRGEQYLKQGEVELANADFNEVLVKDTVVADGSCRHYALFFLGENAKALEWMDKLIELDPNESGSYYDKACLLSRMGKIEKAIAALRIALEKGYRYFAHIENDYDMDAIRNHPDFISLINEYKQKQ